MRHVMVSRLNRLKNYESENEEKKNCNPDESRPRIN